VIRIENRACGKARENWSTNQPKPYFRGLVNCLIDGRAKTHYAGVKPVFPVWRLAIWKPRYHVRVHSTSHQLKNLRNDRESPVRRYQVSILERYPSYLRHTAGSQFPPYQFEELKFEFICHCLYVLHQEMSNLFLD
jgi:hypothetical protein